MKGSRAASRYAKSLIQLAVEKNKLEEVHADMTLMLNTIKENRDLELLMKSPIVKADQKKTILTKLFEGKVSELTYTFLMLITSKRREELVDLVCQSFVTQYREYKNIVTAQVISAVPLDEGIRSKLMKLITESYKDKSEVMLEEHVDEDIIGGLIVRMGDNQVDASIARRINDLKQEFSQNPFVPEY